MTTMRRRILALSEAVAVGAIVFVVGGCAPATPVSTAAPSMLPVPSATPSTSAIPSATPTGGIQHVATSAGYTGVDVASLPGMRPDYPVAAVEGRILYGVLGTVDGTHAYAYDLDAHVLTDLGAAVAGGGVEVMGVTNGILYGQGSDVDGVIRPLVLDLATSRYTLVPYVTESPRPADAPMGIVTATDGRYAVGSWTDQATQATRAFAYDLADGSVIDLARIVGAGKVSTTADAIEDGIVAGTFSEEDGSTYAYAYNLDTDVVSDLNRLPIGMSAPQPKVVHDGIVYGTGTVAADGSEATWSSPWAQAHVEALPGGEGRLRTITSDGRYLLGSMIDGRTATDEPRPAWMLDLGTGERIDLGVLASDKPGKYSGYTFGGTDTLLVGRLIRLVDSTDMDIVTTLWDLPLTK